MVLWFYLFRKRKHCGADGAQRRLLGANPVGFCTKGFGDFSPTSQRKGCTECALCALLARLAKPTKSPILTTAQHLHFSAHKNDSMVM